MKILAFESSAGPASVSLCEDERQIACIWQNSGLTHSATLLPMAEQLLASCGTTLSQIDLFAVAHGPGSFTGLRIGVSTVKGLAQGLDRPCAGISTLEAMAYNQPRGSSILCCVMDARVKQVYNALFDLSGEYPVRLCDDRAIALDALQTSLAGYEHITLTGDGTQLCLKTLQHSSIAAAAETLRWQHAYGVARAAFHHGVSGSAAALVPHYLRLPQAERERLERLAREHSQQSN